MTISLELKRPELLLKQNFINGAWQDGTAAQSMPVLNPATNGEIAQVANSDANDATLALEAAHAAFSGWKITSHSQRAELLRRWHNLILDNIDDLARLMCLEQGKPFAEAKGEVTYGASYVAWYAEECLRIRGEILPSIIPGKLQMIVKEPVGIAAIITPWNFPLAMIARKFAPAIAAGCTVLAKPSEDTPLTALALVKLAEEAGFPPGVINILSASRENTVKVVDLWLNDPRVRKISFTGSTPVGKHLARASADTLKKLSLELGGNAPFIIFDDADLDAAVDGLMGAKFRNGGQTCVSPNRVYVHKAIYDEFAQRLRQRTETLQVGPATNESSDIGPMINAKAIEKIQRHIDDAVAHGASVLSGGSALRNEVADGPFYFCPTILTGVDKSMQICHEETFGPVIPLIMFDDENDVIAAANDTPFGLAAYFYTTNNQRIWRVSSKLETGVVGINEGMTSSAAAPLGGVKDSGYGREGSHLGIEDFLHTKYLCQGNLNLQDDV